jgi:hypothetical protein
MAISKIENSAQVSSCQLKYVHDCSYVQIIFLASLDGQVVIKNYSTVWLDGARPPPISLVISLTNT